MKHASIALAAALLATTAAWAAFTDFDGDGDGLLSADEFVAAFPDATEDMFKAADLNADGMLSEDEHIAAVNAGVLPPAE